MAETKSIAMNDKPLGKRFTHVYADRGKPTSDSPRMRARLGSLLDQSSEYEISKIAERKLGIQTPWSLGTNWRKLLATWEIKDVLDLITVAHNSIYETFDYRGERQTREAESFRKEVDQIFDEENVQYVTDKLGGVHYRHDEEFARSRIATIAALEDARYANVLDAFNRGMQELGQPTPDGKHAIRSVFAALEGLFRMMVPDAPRLTSKEAEKLGPFIQKITADDPTATGASAKSLASLKDWIDAAHFYRHEPGTPDEIAQPPLSLALHLVSVGAAHIRWLAQLDRENTST